MPFIKPIVRLSEAQIRSLLERIISRGQAATAKRGIPESIARQMLESKPPNERIYSQLIDVSEPQAERTRTYPIEEALRTYMEAPDKYRVARTAPPIKHMYPVEPDSPMDVTSNMLGTGGPEDVAGLGQGIAYELMKFRNPLPSNVMPIKKAIVNEMKGVPEMPEMGPVETYAKALEQKFAPPEPKLEGENLKSVMQLSLALEDLWSTTGGGRSMTGTLWKKYLEASRWKNKIKSARDYYVSSAIRFNEDPDKFRKLFPREANVLDRMYDDYLEQTGVDLRSLK